MPDVKLYMFPGSNAVMTAKLMLEHKGIAYSEVRMIPGVHALELLVRGFPTMSVPAMTIDGRRVQGTRSISRALDELVAEPRLFPADPKGRLAVEQAERWGEGFQNATRRIFYAGARRDRAGFLSYIAAPARPVARRVITIGAPLIIRMASGAHRATDEAEREDVALLGERLDQIDAWIEAGVLDGSELNAGRDRVHRPRRALQRSSGRAADRSRRSAGRHNVRRPGADRRVTSAREPAGADEDPQHANSTLVPSERSRLIGRLGYGPSSRPFVFRVWPGAAD
jgi:glutathione S-transferase